MKKPPQTPPKQGFTPTQPKPSGKSYEDNVPASVPDAQETNSESVWAMFQQSIVSTEERLAVAAELAAAKAMDDAASDPDLHPKSGRGAPELESGFADTDFEATNFTDLPSDATQPTPLKPDGV